MLNKSPKIAATKRGALALLLSVSMHPFAVASSRNASADLDGSARRAERTSRTDHSAAIPSSLSRANERVRYELIGLVMPSTEGKADPQTPVQQPGSPRPAQNPIKIG